jgi:hypothetical protein
VIARSLYDFAQAAMEKLQEAVCLTSRHSHHSSAQSQRGIEKAFQTAERD